MWRCSFLFVSSDFEGIRLFYAYICIYISLSHIFHSSIQNLYCIKAFTALPTRVAMKKWKELAWNIEWKYRVTEAKHVMWTNICVNFEKEKWSNIQVVDFDVNLQMIRYVFFFFFFLNFSFSSISLFRFVFFIFRCVWRILVCDSCTEHIVVDGW